MKIVFIIVLTLVIAFIVRFTIWVIVSLKDINKVNKENEALRDKIHNLQNEILQLGLELNDEKLKRIKSDLEEMERQDKICETCIANMFKNKGA